MYIHVCIYIYIHIYVFHHSLQSTNILNRSSPNLNGYFFFMTVLFKNCKSKLVIFEGPIFIHIPEDSKMMLFFFGKVGSSDPNHLEDGLPRLDPVARITPI